MLSTMTWIIILISMLLIKHVILIPKKDREMYKLYEQRDKIAVKAMQGELDQNSVEYKFVIENVNFWIYYTVNDYDFSIIWDNIRTTDKKILKRVENLIKKIKETDILSETMAIVEKQQSRALGLSGFVFEKIIMGGMILLCRVLLFVFDIGYKVTNFGESSLNTLNSYLNNSKKVKEEYREFSRQITYRAQ